MLTVIKETITQKGFYISKQGCPFKNYDESPHFGIT